MYNVAQPLVSIRCLTYNHAPYIRQCLDGFVMQKTNFKFEAIVHDDASTDGTADIVREYATKYPDIIKPILETENQYSKHDGSLSRIMNAAVSPSAKYIAMCEGDDYWTDPYKLQKQVDFLEMNPEYSICYHPVKIFNQKDNILLDDFITKDMPSNTDILDLAKENYIHTVSVVYRYDQDVALDMNRLAPLSFGDYALHMLTARNGKIMKLPDIMAVYRYGIGVWSGTVWNIRRSMQVAIQLSKMAVLMDREDVRQTLISRSNSILNYCSEEFDKQSMQVNQVRKSKAYRLGRLILYPLLWVKNKLS